MSAASRARKRATSRAERAAIAAANVMAADELEQAAGVYRDVATLGRVVSDDPEGHAADWWAEEQSAHYWVGRPINAYRPALIYLVEAGRALCALDRADAETLIRRALAAVTDGAPPPP